MKTTIDVLYTTLFGGVRYSTEQLWKQYTREQYVIRFAIRIYTDKHNTHHLWSRIIFYISLLGFWWNNFLDKPEHIWMYVKHTELSDNVVWDYYKDKHARTEFWGEYIEEILVNQN